MQKKWAAAIAAAARGITMAEPDVYLEKLSAFSRMLHLENLSVSPKETEDAARLLIALGMDDRERVKTALRTVYAKSREEQITFDRVFDGFFLSEEQIRRQAKEQMEREQELEQQVADLEKFHNTADGRVQVWFGLRTIFNNTDELCVRTKELADKYGVGIHMHVAEAKEEKEYTYARWGEGTVKHLERLGVLDKNLLAVHTVWLTDEELELFKKREVKISHNPASAMRVLGFARIPKMLAMGLRPSIGTDGASSSNHMDMVDEMWLTSLIHKGWRLDPTVVPSQDILRMATKWGARALLDEDLYGSLECGKKADLIVIDPHGPSMMPVNDKIAALVTAMHSTNIQSTMCDGKWLMRDRKILTLDEEAILKEACDRAKAIYKRAGIELPDRFPVVKV